MKATSATRSGALVSLDARAAAEWLAPVYASQGWTWGAADGIPTAAEIEETIISLVSSLLVDEVAAATATGRLVLQVRDIMGQGWESHLTLEVPG